MNTSKEIAHPHVMFNIFGWFFGITVISIGIINIFWGNDPEFGIFLILLSLVYFPPVNTFIKRIFGFSIPGVLKMILAVFIIIAAFGVGELFDKIEIMRRGF